MGTSPGSTSSRCFHSSTPTPYHYAEIHGLEPGQTYFYVAQSGGIPAAPAKSFTGNSVGTSGPSTLQGLPFVFTTPQPPAGKLPVLPRAVQRPALRGDDGRADHLQRRRTAARVPAGARPSAVPGGDGAGPDDGHQGARRRLPARRRRPDGRGQAGRRGAGEGGAQPVRRARPRLVRRARQPRPPAQRRRTTTPAARAGSTTSATASGTCSTRASRPGSAPRSAGCGSSGSTPTTSPATAATTARCRRRSGTSSPRRWRPNPDQPTLVFGHHPVSVEANLSSLPPVAFDLDLEQAQRLEALYAGTPGVFLHHAGHTHRNRRTVGHDRRRRGVPGGVGRQGVPRAASPSSGCTRAATR